MNQKNLFLIIVLFLTFTHCNHSRNNVRDISKTKISSNRSLFELQTGDILFQDLDSDPLCDAIEIVTPGFKGSNLSHIGIVNKSKRNEITIIEALPGGVKKTHLDTFLNRSFDINKNPKVIVGRLKMEYQYTIPKAISFILDQIGKEYDDAFLINNEKYYCSELIFEAFSQDSIFKLIPMTFLDPKTNKTQKIWIEYYKKLNIKIPEGEPGINPGVMSLCNKIDIVHRYGKPDGMK